MTLREARRQRLAELPPRQPIDQPEVEELGLAMGSRGQRRRKRQARPTRIAIAGRDWEPCRGDARVPRIEGDPADLLGRNGVARVRDAPSLTSFWRRALGSRAGPCLRRVGRPRIRARIAPVLGSGRLRSVVGGRSHVC